MNPAIEILLTVRREFRKNVRSARGIALGALTLVVSAIAIWICVSIETALRRDVGATSTEMFTEMQRQAIEGATGNASFAERMATLPPSLFIFSKFAVWLGPLLVALLGFDTVAGDLHHRTVRYFTVRTRRWSYFAGKFLGLWAVVGIASGALLAICGVALLAKRYVTPASLAYWAFVFWLVTLPISATWTAIAIFVSSVFRQPNLALLTTSATFFVLWMFGIVGFFSHAREAVHMFQASVGDKLPVVNEMRWYEYLYPNSYDALLLSTKPPEIAKAMAILLGFTALLLAAGSFLFSKRDV